ncbi:MAG: hypothetical protein P8J33_07020 [Pirellulaceae bacterium]|nr:hypothetical protein [Pirellulaceae bacterium]
MRRPHAAVEIPKKLKDDPKNHSLSHEHAQLLVITGRQDDVLTVLKESAKLAPSPEWNRNIADLFAMLSNQADDFESPINSIKTSVGFRPE